MFQSVHPVTQWFKSSMILYKYSSPLCHEPSCGSPSPGRLPESRMLLYWRALLPKRFYPIDQVEVMPSHWKKSSKNSPPDRCANAQQNFDLCKLLSRRGICQETLDEQHPGDLCHHFVCPGTSERQLQWRTSWPPHFWKIPWFGCFKAKFYDSFWLIMTIMPIHLLQSAAYGRWSSRTISSMSEWIEFWNQLSILIGIELHGYKI